VTFWDELRAVTAGPNTLGDITLQGKKLQGEYDSIVNPKGKIRIEARPFAFDEPGYQLLATDIDGPNVKEVYWLPWLKHEVTSAVRDKFEKDSCEFFLTTGLTGCRFTVSPSLVLHVAASAGGGTPDGRSQAEMLHTGGPRDARTRRLSSTNTGAANDFYYEGLHRTLVFGIKRYHGAWTYKIFRTHPPPGTWEIMR
jgi:hypothetical protein